MTTKVHDLGKNVDARLRTVFKHDYHYGTSEASHHDIYHFGSDEGKGDIFVPTPSKQAEPFGWSFSYHDGRKAETIEETPLWFRNRFYIGSVLWGKAMTGSLQADIAIDVIETLENHFEKAEDTEKMRTFVMKRMKQLMGQEQRGWFAKDLVKLFEKYQEEPPLFLILSESNGKTIYQRADTFDPEKLVWRGVTREIVTEIEEAFTWGKRRYIPKKGIVWL